MQLFEHINIPIKFAPSSFSDFLINDKNLKAFDSIRLFCNNFCNNESFRKSHQSFYIFGPAGQGKTHLSAAALHFIFDFFSESYDDYSIKYDSFRNQRDILSAKFKKGEIQIDQFEKANFNLIDFVAKNHCPKVNLLFLNTRLFCDQLRDSWRKKQGKYLTELSSNSDLIVIDDLGNELLNNWHAGYIQEIIQIVLNRYNSNKPTLFNSQYNLEEIGERYLKLFDFNLVDSFLSRISENLIGVKIDGDVFRSNNNSKSNIING